MRSETVVCIFDLLPENATDKEVREGIKRMGRAIERWETMPGSGERFVSLEHKRQALDELEEIQ